MLDISNKGIDLYYERLPDFPDTFTADVTSYDSSDKISSIKYDIMLPSYDIKNEDDFNFGVQILTDDPNIDTSLYFYYNSQKGEWEWIDYIQLDLEEIKDSDPEPSPIPIKYPDQLVSLDINISPKNITVSVKNGKDTASYPHKYISNINFTSLNFYAKGQAELLKEIEENGKILEISNITINDSTVSAWKPYSSAPGFVGIDTAKGGIITIYRKHEFG
jgi:hypothetical protein